MFVLTWVVKFRFRQDFVRFVHRAFHLLHVIRSLAFLLIEHNTQHTLTLLPTKNLYFDMKDQDLDAILYAFSVSPAVLFKEFFFTISQKFP